MTLTEFLLARIAEDEAQAEQRFAEWRESGGVLDLVVTLGPARVLAECEAKRRVVELHFPVLLTYWPDRMCITCIDVAAEPVPDPLGAPGTWTPNAAFPCATLRTLAAVYADHPDYRPEWRP